MDIGTEIGPYRVDSLIARGGRGEVYKVWHLGLHRYEAMKLLPPEMTFDRSFVERFLSESRIAAQLHHLNIAIIHSVSDAAGPEYYFTMELVDGEDLADYLRREGKLSIEQALPILRQIADALDYAHRNGIIHRDVKPGNVLIGAGKSGARVIKVVDFGIARAHEVEGAPRLTKTGMIVGTPEYMSPEQAGNGVPVDHRTDIYSLGIIAYEMLCGQPPFFAQGDASPISVIISHIRDEPPPPITLAPGVPPEVSDALLRALNKNPDDRYPSCAAFVRALVPAEPEPEIPIAGLDLPNGSNAEIDAPVSGKEDAALLAAPVDSQSETFSGTRAASHGILSYIGVIGVMLVGLAMIWKGMAHQTQNIPIEIPPAVSGQSAASSSGIAQQPGVSLSGVGRQPGVSLSGVGRQPGDLSPGGISAPPAPAAPLKPHLAGTPTVAVVRPTIKSSGGTIVHHIERPAISSSSHESSDSSTSRRRHEAQTAEYHARNVRSSAEQGGVRHSVENKPPRQHGGIPKSSTLPRIPVHLHLPPR